MIKRQRQDLVGREPGAVFVHNAEAVSITVQTQAELGFAAADEFTDFGHAFRVRFGVMAPEQRIEFVMKSNHPDARVRSEEHTSELQSRLHLVCRLLLEKK